MLHVRMQERREQDSPQSHGGARKNPESRELPAGEEVRQQDAPQDSDDASQDPNVAPQLARDRERGFFGGRQQTRWVHEVGRSVGGAEPTPGKDGDEPPDGSLLSRSSIES